jgi:hypothetical protein
MSAVTLTEDATMFCLDDGLTLDALFAFAAFALVFAIGLAWGCWSAAHESDMVPVCGGCSCSCRCGFCL